MIRGGRRRIFCAYISAHVAQNPRIKKLVVLLGEQNIPLEWVDKQRVMQLSGSKENQGVVLHSSLYPYVPSAKLMDQRRLLLLDNVEDPHNVGAILRSAEIFGFSSVMLPHRGTPDIYPSIVKVSAGATEFLQIAKDGSANDYARQAKESGHQIIALDGHGDRILDEVVQEPLDKFMLVIGGEDKSVGQFILNNAEYIVRIRQHGEINSLNASVATGIALFALSGK